MKNYEKLNILGKNIKRFRRAENLSQNELAEKLDISREHLAKIETAKKFASLQLIFKIAQTLQVEVYRLFEF